jgi:hypothetical protein
MRWNPYDEGPALVHWVDDVELTVKTDKDVGMEKEKTIAIFRKGEEVMVDIFHDHGETVDFQLADGSVAFNVQKLWFRRKRLNGGT